LGRLLELVREALAVGGAVIDDGDALGGHLPDRVLAQHLALLDVVRHHAEGALVALLGVLGIGGRRRDLRYAGVVVDLGRGYGRAGIQVADDARDLAVHELLRDDRAGLGIRLVVLAHQLELHLRAADRQAFRIGLLDRQPGAVVVVLAQVRLRAREGRDLPDLHHHFRWRLRRFCLLRRRRRWWGFLLTRGEERR